MRRWFAQLPIRGKLIVVMLMTTAVVVTLVSAGHLAAQYDAAKEDAANDLEAQARLVLVIAAAPLTFEMRSEAEEAVRALRFNANIRIACLYDKDGALFVDYRPAGVTCPERAPDDVVTVEGNRIIVAASDIQDGRRWSTLYIRSDVTELRQRVWEQAIIIGIVMLIAIGVAVVISARLQALVSAPIMDLSRAASAVADRGDYTIRAQRHTEDEVGTLVDAFNGMLDRIQQREEELSRANEDLRREVVERRRAEEERAELLVREREANRLKDEFLATLSHELRTPLNAILGWTKLLRSHALPADSVDRAMEKVERNAQAQARLIEDLLEVSRITTGKLRLEMRDFDLGTLAVTAVDSIRPAAEARGVRVERDFVPGMFRTTGDPDRLQQVIWNLLSNAVKFTPAGGSIRISIERTGDVDVIEVADTGIGIDPQFMPHVFDTFRQADASATRAHGGLGLGLSIVRHLVEMHGGTVSASSDGHDAGAAFTVRLPVRSTVHVAAEVERRDVVPRGALTGATIVAVDDDTDTRELLQSVLEAAGARVHAAGSADEALLACEQDPPDALVSDIGMPGRDGYSLLQELRATMGSRAPRVTVALSAYAAASDRERSVAAGYQRHVAKPVDPAALVLMLRELLETTAPIA